MRGAAGGLPHGAGPAVGNSHADGGPSARAIDVLKERPVDLQQVLREAERQWYEAALRQSGGNMAQAARLLGIKPPAFRKAVRERFGGLE